MSYGATVAVDDIDLSVRSGEIFGLLGPNGAGKTSALSAVEGLLRPVAGNITIGEVDARAHPLQGKTQLGVQLQSTSFHADLTLLEIVRLFAGLYGVSLSAGQVRDRLSEIQLDSRGHEALPRALRGAAAAVLVAHRDHPRPTAAPAR